MQRRTVWGLVVLGAVAVSSVLGCGEDEAEVIEGPVASFVGGSVCAECHEVERDLWSGSHHDLAMQVASEETVLGDFAGTEFTHFGVTSTFSRRDGGFFMRTEGPAGELEDYEIKYVFGVEPLQQYLVEFPGGRFQVSSLCWDTRPAAEGGQRWFHVYGDEEIAYDDVLHWTGSNQNWNFMCAECHSTDLQKNYDLASDSYRTQWSEINVSCEACHGPGSNHVTWARDLAPGATSTDYVKMGLEVSLKNPDGGTWVFDPGEKVARRTTPRTSRSQIESCARCHSRRSVILAPYEHGQPLLDTHMPALLEERLYHADGQISEEVYVYGSFLQSLMYQKGVTCSDCHEPHGLNLIAEGNNLCSRCHTPEAYDSPAHHFHQAGSTGASCVECHMPERTYMVVDPRRDHSIRIPRPDLSVSLGTPNACVLCHVDQSDQWAVDAVGEWYPPDAAAPPHYAEALDAGRKGSSGAEVALSELVTNEEAPGLVRASALTLLDPMDSETTLRAIGAGVADDDPLVRRAALVALAEAQEGARVPLGYPLLLDPIRGVRVEAVNALASVRSRMTNAQQEVFDRAAAEYIAAQVANSDRFISHINLGVHYLNVGQRAEAETSYRTAMRLDPSSIEPYVNLADLYREQNRDDRGEPLLRDALRLSPASADVHHALGLLLVRADRDSEAVESLRRATNLAPANVRFAYAYALCLYEDQQLEAAVQSLQQTHRRHPGDRNVLWSLILIHRDLGQKNEALQYARRLVVLAPDNPDYVGLLQELERDG